ncbi:MAG: transcription elongation factor GreA [Patescibacteria group bacterium]
MDNNQTYLTKEGYKKLKKELEYLINTKRKEVADRIQSAKELGDLSENAEYSDAKDEQAFLEGKIAETTNVLHHADIIENSRVKKEIVEVGCTLEVKDGKGQHKTYKIVGSKEADPSSGLISNESPIGRAFLGGKVNDTVEFQAPKGIIKFEIISIR